MVAILAHRGASASAPENTIAAFEEARRLGADGVELDARATADGTVVVCHDPVLAGLGAVASASVDDLPPHVPTLWAALDACAGMLVNVELKDLPGEPGFDAGRSLAGAVARLVADRGTFDSVIVSSFDLVAIDVAHATDDRLVTGWLTMGGYDQMRALESVAERGHRALHPHHEAVTAELVIASHEQGIRIVTWTVDKPADLHRVVRAGVDAVITNFPDVARSELRA